MAGHSGHEYITLEQTAQAVLHKINEWRNRVIGGYEPEGKGAVKIITQALYEERETCAKRVEAMERHYPTDVFLPPPRGEHGKTVDACSAAAIRAILPAIAAAIRQGRT